jgi:hypothetical protein
MDIDDLERALNSDHERRGLDTSTCLELIAEVRQLRAQLAASRSREFDSAIHDPSGLLED